MTKPKSLSVPLISAYAAEFAKEPRLKSVTLELFSQNVSFFLVTISRHIIVFKEIYFVYMHVATEVGFSFLFNTTGRLFGKGQISLRDIDANTESIGAVMRVSRGTGRFSSYLLQRSILEFYERSGLFPSGITRDLECIQNWSLKQANALQRLVPRLNQCLNLSTYNHT